MVSLIPENVKTKHNYSIVNLLLTAFHAQIFHSKSDLDANGTFNHGILISNMTKRVINIQGGWKCSNTLQRNKVYGNRACGRNDVQNH